MPITITPKLARHMWANRLESGRVTQGRGKLGLLDGSRCCLGVACDLAVDLGVLKIFDPDDGDLSVYPEVKDMLGITTGDGGYADRSLVQDNDTSGHSFAVIAATIRSEPEGLFA